MEKEHPINTNELFVTSGGNCGQIQYGCEKWPGNKAGVICTILFSMTLDVTFATRLVERVIVNNYRCRPGWP